jgi:hypothetical protein
MDSWSHPAHGAQLLINFHGFDRAEAASGNDRSSTMPSPINTRSRFGSRAMTFSMLRQKLVQSICMLSYLMARFKSTTATGAVMPGAVITGAATMHGHLLAFNSYLWLIGCSLTNGS